MSIKMIGMWIELFDLFLFDFDGTLVDTEALHFAAYRTLLESRGYALPWDFKEFCFYAHRGAAKEEIYRLFPIEEPWELLYREKTELYLELLFNKPVPLMEGAASLLSLLKKKKIPHVIVTNSPKEAIEAIVSNQEELQGIPAICRQDYKTSKPDPECYLLAIERYGKEAKRIIGFEDSFRGYEALCGTEALPVLICSENHPQLLEKKPKVYFSSFAKIPENWLP